MYSELPCASVVKYVAKTDQMTEMMKKCLELKAKLNGKPTDELSDTVEKVNYVCRKALVESHTSAGHFWSKYR